LTLLLADKNPEKYDRAAAARFVPGGLREENDAARIPKVPRPSDPLPGCNEPDALVERGYLTKT
jgi:hypothetical protein